MLLHLGSKPVLVASSVDIVRDILKTHDPFGTFNIGEYIPWLKWVNKINGLDSRVKKVAKDMDAFLDSVIEERVIRNNKGEYSTGEAKDFVDVLLEIQNGKETGFTLQRDSLKAILLAFLKLFDPPGVTTELFLIMCVSVNAKDSFIAVIKETLRLNPPFPIPVP
ncbi:hypothetical protein RDI58_008522 [Solanum bulbocastanum]|uniref:Cytochrome P450 n=1 Tax=Solanum bulbocastanum TaxID=147425 RepID=A0AAN8YIM7_SOLBU